jgi:hypothetical protein
MARFADLPPVALAKIILDCDKETIPAFIRTNKSVNNVWDDPRMLSCWLAKWKPCRGLLAACIRGRTETVRRLLEFRGSSPLPLNAGLVQAATYGQEEVVDVLLRHGADVHSDKDSALRLAVLYGHAQVVKKLVASGADVRAMDCQAMAVATKHGRKDIIDHLSGPAPVAVA